MNPSKRNITSLAATLCLAATISGFAFAQSSDSPPRGADIGIGAGNCSVGPFGTSGDTGQYTGLCQQLTPEEICLAFFKGHFLENGDMTPAEDTAKAQFCSQKLIRQLSKG